MSTTIQSDPDEYTTGSDRFIRFGEDFLDVEFSKIQKKILRAVADNQRTLIVGGNGPGKTFSMAGCVLAYLYGIEDSIFMGTSGSYTQFRDTLWRPMESMHENLKEKGLPGRTKGDKSPELEIDNNWFGKVVSPRDPSELEGRHGNGVLVVIEEADKPYITEEHFDSANSSITDSDDRLVAIANPPKDPSDVVNKKRESDRWKVIEFSSFDSRNVRVDAGLIDEDRLPGIVDLPTIAEDWEEWNNEPWPEKPYWCPSVTELKNKVEQGEITHDEICEFLRPGFESVRNAHREREDLDERWYRRRAGISPKSSASIYRPFYSNEVQDAYVPAIDTSGLIPLAAALDVARQGGDWNCLTVVYGPGLVPYDRWKGVDHVENQAIVEQFLEHAPHRMPLVVDAQGEGSGLADMLADSHPNTIRFKSGSKPKEPTKYYDCWSEGLDEFGGYIRNDGVFTGSYLREEALSVSRTIDNEEKYYKSRDAEVIKSSGKDDVKEKLGRSPDVFDSAMMALWALKETKEQRLFW